MSRPKFKPRWSSKETSFLEENYGSITADGCSKVLDRTKPAIYGKARLMGLDSYKMKTDREFDYDWSVAECAYVAGLIDADGCISWSRGIPYIELAMTHKPTVDWFGEKVGGNTNVRYPIDDTRRLPFYRVSVAAKHKVKLILIKISPYMITKKEKALKALSQLE